MSPKEVIQRTRGEIAREANALHDAAERAQAHASLACAVFTPGADPDFCAKCSGMTHEHKKGARQ